MAHRIGCGLNPIGKTEFLQNGAHMVACGLLAEHQRCGDVGIGLPYFISAFLCYDF